MGPFDHDPAYQDLVRLREEEGYDGPLSYGAEDTTYTKADPTSREAEILDALRRRGAGT